jgi:hypothetical protein
MGRHHEDDPERRRQGGLRWKGDTTDSIPVVSVPPWETHTGITEETVEGFLASFRQSNPPAMDAPELHARYAWLIERSGGRTWVRAASGYTNVDYPTTRAASIDMMRTWFLWNGIVQPGVRRLHTIWVRHATEAAWSERLDGR